MGHLLAKDKERPRVPHHQIGVNTCQLWAPYKEREKQSKLRKTKSSSLPNWGEHMSTLDPLQGERDTQSKLQGPRRLAAYRTDQVSEDIGSRRDRYSAETERLINAHLVSMTLGV